MKNYAILNPNTIDNRVTLWKLVAGYKKSLFITTNGDVWGTDKLRHHFIVDAAIGYKHTLFLTLDGGVITKFDDQTDQSTASPLSAKDIVAISAGNVHSVALTAQGTIYTWGDNTYGQLKSPNLRNICSIAAGHFHTLALDMYGVVQAWGDNRYAQCTIPIFNSEVVAIAAGAQHSLALTADGTVVAWGSNICGQCTVPKSAVNIKQIAAGALYSMALTQDGKIIVWGNHKAFPKHLLPNNRIDSVAAGGWHSLAQTTDGIIIGWGQRAQRSNGTIIDWVSSDESHLAFDHPTYLRIYVKNVKSRTAYEHEKANVWRSNVSNLTDTLRAKQIEAEQKRKEEDRLNAERTRITALLKQLCRDDFLAVDQAFHNQSTLNNADLVHIKTTFLREWFVQHLPAGYTQPDDDQLNAIGALHGNVQVVARAGSGKTSTLVNRVFFLMKHCRVQAHEIMMLAFNRKAAHEIRERLLRLLYPQRASDYNKIKAERWNKAFGEDDEVQISLDAMTHLRNQYDIALPFVMTFHGLAHNIYKPKETIIYDTRDPEGAIQSKALQTIIDDHIRAQDKVAVNIRQLMIRYFKGAWMNIEENNYDLPKAEFLQYRRSILHLSLNGEPVKSYGEKKIADFLFSHDVEYKYERDVLVNKIRYKPDFTLWKDNTTIIIEYVGMKGDADYDELIAQKRQAFSRPNYKLIEVTREVISDEKKFRTYMYDLLKSLDIIYRELDDDEIWERIKDRSVDNFSRLMNNFIQKCRQLLVTPSDLEIRIKTHQPLHEDNLEIAFAKVALRLYKEYIDHCNEYNEIDFSEIMQRATQLIREGQSDFSKRHSHGSITQIRFISVDEFQDFSVLFYELLTAMRTLNPTMQLFCVGDDWQAINRFAGADTRYFTDFERYIGSRIQCTLATNYRSAGRIVNMGNALMRERGTPAKAAKADGGEIVLVYIDNFASTDNESKYFGKYVYDVVALSRLLNLHMQQKHSVSVLSRTEAPLKDAFPKITKLFKHTNDTKLVRSTTHGYKGLEQSSVILWDVTERQYPMIHPHWIFGRILGDTLEQIIEDERRLFYVGVTRASQTLYIMTRRQSMSPFLKDVLQSCTVTELDINSLPVINELRSDAMFVRLSGNTFEIKDYFKQYGYKWSAPHKVWEKRVIIAEFSQTQITQETWAAHATNITVTCVDENDETVWYKFRVDAGKITEIME